MSFLAGSAVARWLMPRTPDPEVGGSSPTRVKPCCVLEQGTFTPQKVLVIPRKRWLRPNMTEKLFTGTLRINQPTIISSSLQKLELMFMKRYAPNRCLYIKVAKLRTGVGSAEM